jgi:hypothetical protein
MMLLMPHGPPPMVLQDRQRLVFALQQAHSRRRYDAASLRTAIGEFAQTARHRGLDLKWVLDAVQDAIDSGVFPALSETQRRALSEPVQRIVGEAYGHWHKGLGHRAVTDPGHTLHLADAASRLIEG